MHKKIFPILILSSFLFSSCKKDLPDVGGTAAQNMANEWWVQTKLDGVDLTGFLKIATSNTAADGNEIWVDDLKHIWPFKIKAQANFNTLTFSATNMESLYLITPIGPNPPPPYFPEVTITEGKVILNGGHSKVGNITDSIYMKIEFSDDPGTIYEITGHGRTKFIEDEY